MRAAHPHVLKKHWKLLTILPRHWQWKLYGKGKFPNSRRNEIRALLHEWPGIEPHTVPDIEDIFHDDIVLPTRMRIYPLVGSKPSDQERQQADAEERRHQIAPDFSREWRQEREKWLHFGRRFLEQDADARVHERHREVDGFFSLRVDGQVCDRHVSFLNTRKL